MQNINEEDKYHTPNINDSRVGYEYESGMGSYYSIWPKQAIENLYVLERFCKYNQKRSRRGNLEPSIRE
jgi:hypothetical protein